MTLLPNKLHSDCIQEAVFQFRFNVPEPTELIIGRLIDCPDWADFTKRRTPISEIPIQIRNSDPNLRHQPLYELKSKTLPFQVRVGSHSLSLDNLAPYKGWDDYQKFILQGVAFFFSKFPDVKIDRLGLRYINATKKDDHFISSISDLRLGVTIGDSEIGGDLNVNIKRKIADDIEITMRVATPSFVDGPTPDNITTIIDIDVYTRV